MCLNVCILLVGIWGSISDKYIGNKTDGDEAIINSRESQRM